jgi:hypothetical protein
MYAVSKIKEKKLKSLVEIQNKSFKDNGNVKKISTKSQKINDEIKQNIFKKIFKLLDKRNKNKILGSNIDINVLPEKIKKIIEPLIQELRDQNESLTGEEFVMACEHLFRVFILNIIFR